MSGTHQTVGLLGGGGSAGGSMTDQQIQAAYAREVLKISTDEILAGTETAVRRFSPEDVYAMIIAHGGQMTGQEVADAYATIVAQISAAEIAAGTETGLRTLSPKDVKDMITAHAPSGGGGSGAFLPISEPTVDSVENTTVKTPVINFTIPGNFLPLNGVVEVIAMSLQKNYQGGSVVFDGYANVNGSEVNYDTRSVASKYNNGFHIARMGLWRYANDGIRLLYTDDNSYHNFSNMPLIMLDTSRGLRTYGIGSGHDFTQDLPVTISVQMDVADPSAFLHVYKANAYRSI